MGMTKEQKIEYLRKNIALYGPGSFRFNSKDELEKIEETAPVEEKKEEIKNNEVKK
jgi:hypothetical protein